MLLERRAAALADAAGVPVAALDRGLALWDRPTPLEAPADGRARRAPAPPCGSGDPSRLDPADPAVAQALVALQRAAYAVEAGLIGSDAIPALRETADSWRPRTSASSATSGLGLRRLPPRRRTAPSTSTSSSCTRRPSAGASPPRCSTRWTPRSRTPTPDGRHRGRQRARARALRRPRFGSANVPRQPGCDRRARQRVPSSRLTVPRSARPDAPHPRPLPATAVPPAPDARRRAARPPRGRDVARGPRARRLPRARRSSASLLPAEPTYDPLPWLIWGRELAHGTLSTTTGPSWKPLPGRVHDAVQPARRRGRARSCGSSSRAPARCSAWRWATGSAARLAGRWPGVFAGPAILASEGYAFNAWRGNSEGLLVGLALWAVERHLDGRRTWAFVLGFAAALLRPEVWPFWGLYGLWLAWRSRRRACSCAACFAAIPLAWFRPEYARLGRPRCAPRAAPASPTWTRPRTPPSRRSRCCAARWPAAARGHASGAVAAFVAALRRRGACTTTSCWSWPPAGGAAARRRASMTQARLQRATCATSCCRSPSCVLAGAGWVEAVRAAGAARGRRAASLAAARPRRRAAHAGAGEPGTSAASAGRAPRGRPRSATCPAMVAAPAAAAR